MNLTATATAESSPTPASSGGTENRSAAARTYRYEDGLPTWIELRPFMIPTGERSVGHFELDGIRDEVVRIFQTEQRQRGRAQTDPSDALSTEAVTALRGVVGQIQRRADLLPMPGVVGLPDGLSAEIFVLGDVVAVVRKENGALPGRLPSGRSPDAAEWGIALGVVTVTQPNPGDYVIALVVYRP